jgi:hypothetical protein
MRSRFLYIALAILVARKLLLSRNVMTKASKMLPTKQGPRATLVRHPSARRRLIRRSRRRNSKTRLRRQKIALERTGRNRDALVKPAAHSDPANHSVVFNRILCAAAKRGVTI